MADAELTLAQLRERVQAFVHERDWEQFHSPKNLSMALAVEAAELMEGFIWDTTERSYERGREPAVADELADVIVYAVELANICGIDIADAVEAKMRKNAEKYPVAKARGKALKYTELG